MNNSYSRPKYTQRHLKLWIYFLPVIGIFPALWTLYRTSSKIPENSLSNREQKKASRLSLSLVLVWLSSYSLLSLGAANGSEIISFRLLYVNAIVTTAYFVTCTILMSRLGNKNLPLADQIEPN